VAKARSASALVPNVAESFDLAAWPVRGLNATFRFSALNFQTPQKGRSSIDRGIGGMFGGGGSVYAEWDISSVSLCETPLA